jgi:hypothetical protein
VAPCWRTAGTPERERGSRLKPGAGLYEHEAAPAEIPVTRDGRLRVQASQAGVPLCEDEADREMSGPFPHLAGRPVIRSGSRPYVTCANASD